VHFYSSSRDIVLCKASCHAEVHGLIQTPGNGSELQQRRPDALGTSLPSLIPVSPWCPLPATSYVLVYHLRLSPPHLLAIATLPFLSTAALSISTPDTRRPRSPCLSSWTPSSLVSSVR